MGTNMTELPARKGHILGGGSFVRAGEQRFVLALVDLDDSQPSVEMVDIEFLAHAMAVDPRSPQRLALFEKHGPGACTVDLATLQMVGLIRTPRKRQFYGHGSYSADGALLYAIESYVEDALRGAVIVRDADTLEELGELPSYGVAPHDCMLIDEGRTMVLTNGGGPLHSDDRPSVCFIDLASEKLLERVELSAGAFNAGHLAMTAAGDFALVSAPREGLPKQSAGLGAVSLRRVGQPLQTLRKPKAVVRRMKGETLSVVIHEPDGTVVATHPEGDMVSMWRLADGALVRKYTEFKGPCGVCLTLDQSAYVVSHMHEGHAGLTLLATDTREPLHTVPSTFMSGSHIFAHAFANT